MAAIMALRRFIIERDIPKVGSLERERLRGAATKITEIRKMIDPTTERADEPGAGAA
jgi:hypothetical protein